jgi:hypothetical protein
MTRAELTAAEFEANAHEAFIALREHLTAAEFEFVLRVFHEHYERAALLVASRRGEWLSHKQFALFFLDVAKRIDREGGTPS